jgi:hypothetical protein
MHLTVGSVMQKGGDKLGYESEAFAIYDTMKYIKPEVHTLCVGTAFGESAMLLAAGTAVSSSHHLPTCLENLNPEPEILHLCAGKNVPGPTHILCRCSSMLRKIAMPVSGLGPLWLRVQVHIMLL